MVGLTQLPYEVLATIVRNVDFDDTFNLGQTCKELNFLLREESICKAVVQSKIRHSNEALDALAAGGGNSRALRRCAKRREALRTVRPFAVATVAFCDAYLYCKGVLCYTLDDRVRILDLHNSAQNEIVISIPGLLTQALSEISDHYKGIFEVLYYSDRMVSCTYKSCGEDPTAWLITFGLSPKRILAVKELDSTDKIFVRHNKNYLYFGTHSERGADGFKKWVLHGYDFTTRKWFDQKLHLPDLVGSEIGSTVCFELYNGFFYGLSNQTSFEVEEIDWTSFYHCFRFPLGCPCKELLEKTENDSRMWRRQHQEGPIDDRWTNLRLHIDEESGALKIVESRKEWYLGCSRSQRTYYTSDVIFPDRPDQDLELSAELSCFASAEFDSSIPTSTNPAFNTNIVETSASSSSSSFHNHNLAALPAGPLKILLQKSDHPLYIPPPPRKPQQTHPGNDGSSQPTFTLAKSRVRTYQTSCSTFMDLVDDPEPMDWEGKQRLRLRAGYRRLGPPLVYPSDHAEKPGVLRPPDEDLQVALKEMYRESEIQLWPEAQNPDNPDEDLDAIYKLLNPPTHLGNVEGTADERGIVYVTGSNNGPQAVIFISFDPATKLVGLKRWGGLDTKGVGEGPHIDGRAAGCFLDESKELGNEKGKVKYVDVEECDRTISIDRKGKGKEKLAPFVQVTSTGPQAVLVDLSEGVSGTLEGHARSGETNRSWAWREKAMYQDIRVGFSFGLGKGELASF